jgi:hypothetical protein
MIQQHIDVAVPFTKLFNSTQIVRVLELGTANGGFTLLVRDLLNSCNLEQVEFKSYDIHPHNYLEAHIQTGSNINFICKNNFNHTYDNLSEDEELTSYIQQPGITLVLCDGGCKKVELNILSKYLKVGDIIMAHDYAPSLEYFNRHNLDKIWNWCEIQDSDIEEVCKTNNLQPYYAEDFVKVAWVSKIKTS